MSKVAFLLPPALGSSQGVVAGNAIHLAELRPRTALGIAGDAQHAFAHLHRLADAPRPHPEQRVGILLNPVRGLGCGVGVKLESKIRMAGSDQLVIDMQPWRAEMAA